MTDQNNKKKRTGKQWAALIAVILIGLILLGLLISAIIDPTGIWFRSFLILAIAVPILAWVYIWLYGVVTGRHTMASVDLDLGAEDTTDEDA